MSRLRSYREAAGLSQTDLAMRAGVSRQLIGAAEAGRNLPRVDAGIALAEALSVTVAELFAEPTLPVDVITGHPVTEGVAVRVGRVGALVVAAPSPDAPLRWDPIDGVVDGGSFVPVADLRTGLVVAGCEPALELLETGLRRRGASALAVMTSSASAIEALRGGRVHAAVVHGPALRRADELPAIVRVRLASWEVGLADAPDAPSGWLETALSGREPVVQREVGAGVQQAFEAAVPAAVTEVPGPRCHGSPGRQTAHPPNVPPVRSLLRECRSTPLAAQIRGGCRPEGPVLR